MFVYSENTSTIMNKEKGRIYKTFYKTLCKTFIKFALFSHFRN